MAEEKSEEQTTAEGDVVDVEQADEALAEDAAAADPDNDADAAESDDAPVDLEAELEAAKDAALRAQADAMNVQRRAEQEVEKARKFALERFCGDLLSVSTTWSARWNPVVMNRAVRHWLRAWN